MGERNLPFRFRPTTQWFDTLEQRDEMLSQLLPASLFFHESTIDCALFGGYYSPIREPHLSRVAMAGCILARILIERQPQKGILFHIRYYTEDGGCFCKIFTDIFPVNTRVDAWLLASFAHMCACIAAPVSLWHPQARRVPLEPYHPHLQDGSVG
jgi:hypothetical protein